MAWMASNIYVKHPDRGVVVGVLERLLLGGEHQRDQEGILDPPGPMVVSPVHEGWVVVSGVGSWLDDLNWAAKELSCETGGLTASLDMIGNSYRLRYSEQRGGEQLKELQMPDHGWAGEMDEPPRMPSYQDVERLAFETLSELGVPRCLITIGTSPLGYPEPAPLEGGDAVQLSLDGARVERGEMPCLVVPFEGDDPPVLPTHITRDFGEMLFEERYVEGAPEQQALARLLEIEDELLARAKRAAPAEEVTLTVSYYTAAHQERLNNMLQQQDRLNLNKDQRLKRAPWWTFWRFFGRLK